MNFPDRFWLLDENGDSFLNTRPTRHDPVSVPIGYHHRPDAERDCAFYSKRDGLPLTVSDTLDPVSRPTAHTFNALAESRRAEELRAATPHMPAPSIDPAEIVSTLADLADAGRRQIAAAYDPEVLAAGQRLGWIDIADGFARITHAGRRELTRRTLADSTEVDTLC